MPKKVITHTNSEYNGVAFDQKIVAVSIIRAGDSMIHSIREVAQKIKIGKILIQRDEKTASPQLYYVKLPKDIKNRFVLLCDPCLATGGSVIKSVKHFIFLSFSYFLQKIEVLISYGVQEKNIIFVNLLSCPEGIININTRYPQVKIITTAIDERLNEKKYIIPGIGDFGDRYFSDQSMPESKLGTTLFGSKL